MSSVLTPPSAAGSNSAATVETSDSPTEWGDLAAAAKAAGTLKLEWKVFITTKFFVPILRSQDDNPKNFLLHMTGIADDGNAALIISQVRERLDRQQGDGIVALSGADIVCRLDEQGSVQVALRNGAFSISTKRVDWLRSGIGVTRKRVATRKILLAAAPAAPLPVLGATGAARASGPGTKPMPQVADVRKYRYVKPAVLSVLAIGIVAAIAIPLSLGPGETTAPVPFEVLPPPPVVSPSIPVVAAAEHVMTFTPADNSFSVTLPGLAEEVELSPDQVIQMGDNRMHQYRLRFEDRMYAMEATDYFASMPQNLTAEMDARQASIVGRDGTLIQAKPVTLHGNATGREVRVRLPNGGERAARFAFIDSKFCLVMVTVPNGAASAAQIDTFLNSFQLN